LSHDDIASKGEAKMTMTKVLYVVAAVVPFGCIILACVGIFHVVMVAKRERKQRQQAQLATC
jgi:hypothetical protein